jgi:hypothetical protein
LPNEDRLNASPSFPGARLTGLAARRGGIQIAGLFSPEKDIDRRDKSRATTAGENGSVLLKRGSFDGGA